MAFGAALKAGLGYAAAGAIGNLATEKLGPALGIPRPGDAQLDFMNRAYPGTTPWERLGSPASGVRAAGVAQAKVARINAAAGIAQAKIQAGATERAAATAAAPKHELNPALIDAAAAKAGLDRTSAWTKTIEAYYHREGHLRGLYSVFRDVVNGVGGAWDKLWQELLPGLYRQDGPVPPLDKKQGEKFMRELLNLEEEPLRQPPSRLGPGISAPRS